MNAYNGQEPYVFFSYAHADRENVEKIIIGLKQKMCRIWYDEGLTPGESWNDELAEHLKKSEIVVIMITNKSVISPYVKAEINYAISKQIKILPVFLEAIDLPAGLEMLLGSVQHLFLSDISEIDKCISEIASNLPNEVFARKKVPFLETEKYAFFLEKDIAINGAYANEKHADSFIISYNDFHQNDKHNKLFSFTGSLAYDIDYSITQCKLINDDYFVGNITGIYLFNVLAKCELDYPLFGPDFQLLLIFALRIPDETEPTVQLIDYQYIHITQSKGLEEKNIEETSWGHMIDEQCKRKLYQLNSID